MIVNCFVTTALTASVTETENDKFPHSWVFRQMTQLRDSTPSRLGYFPDALHWYGVVPPDAVNCDE